MHFGLLKPCPAVKTNSYEQRHVISNNGILTSVVSDQPV